MHGSAGTGAAEVGEPVRIVEQGTLLLPELRSRIRAGSDSRARAVATSRRVGAVAIADLAILDKCESEARASTLLPA